MAEKKHKKDDWVGLTIPTGLFIGLGFGFLYGHLVPGVLLGLGAGFLAMLILRAMKK